MKVLVSNGTAIPLGNIFPGVHTYVLDQHLAPVLIGLPGELYIGGHGVAKGVLESASAHGGNRVDS